MQCATDCSSEHHWDNYHCECNVHAQRTACHGDVLQSCQPPLCKTSLCKKLQCSLASSIHWHVILMECYEQDMVSIYKQGSSPLPWAELLQLSGQRYQQLCSADSGS